jgi:hypothetical protein
LLLALCFFIVSYFARWKQVEIRKVNPDYSMKTSYDGQIWEKPYFKNDDIVKHAKNQPILVFFFF